MRQGRTPAELTSAGLGESLLRLSAPGHERLGQSPSLDVRVGGAEMNVLIALRAFGANARWLTRMADNALGHVIIQHARAHDVEVLVDWDANARAPLYFVEHGVAPRPSEVVYDRAMTAMTRLTPSSFSWDDVVNDVDVALSSGITCALAADAAGSVGAFFSASQAAGALTVFDVNYRSRLWGWDEATPALRTVLPAVDVLSASRHDLLHLVDDASGTDSDVDLAARSIAQWGHRVVLLRNTRYPAPGLVRVAATAVTSDEVVTSEPYDAQVVDPFGAGDAFLGAFLASWLTDDDLEGALELGAWAAAFHHTVVGDAWQGRLADLTTRQEARKVLR